jgi:hypothetical protein
MKPTRILQLATILACSVLLRASAQTPGAPRYEIGSPTLTDLWVDPTTGLDTQSGASNAPLRTLDEAWARIPIGVTLTTGNRILLQPGDYPESSLPVYFDTRLGTAAAPVIIQAAAGRGTVRLHGYLNIHACRYLYLLDIDIVTDPGTGGGANAVHLEACDHVLLRGCRLDGFDGTVRQTQETLKANQTQHLYVEECDISGAFWYPLDYVAVQYGHILASRIHNAGEWCLLVKGGSAHLRIEGNEIDHGDTGGFIAGNGTGFEFMTPPWIHYEVEDIKFVNNYIHHTGIAGMGVNGGYNVLLAYNTLYKVGTNDHVIEVLHGSHGNDGNTARCTELNAAGGWGNTQPESAYIPSRNIYLYNNLIYNPTGFGSRWQHFNLGGPVTPPADSNVPNPSHVDDNLRIVGNLIWNGPSDHPLGFGDPGTGGQDDNPTCNRAQVLADNAINQTEPQLVDPEHGDFRPLPGTSLHIPMQPIPPFPGDDRPQTPLAPAGNLVNTCNANVVGAFRPWSLFGIGATSPLLWDGAVDLGGGWRWLGWFGFFHDSGTGWIYHAQHGWMYATGTNPTEILFWTADLNWLWSGSTLYPYLYRFTPAAWLWYLTDSTSPRWFYNFTSNDWESW